MDDILSIPLKALEHLNVMWTFFLLLMRFTGFLYIVPGLGGGLAGLTIRWPAALVLAYCSMFASPYAPLPPDAAIMLLQLTAELMFGMLLGVIPMLIINGVQIGAQVASGSMGLGAGELIDPTTGGTLSDLGRLFGDLAVILFLVLGGHYAIIYGLSGLSSGLVPGSFAIDDFAARLLIDRTGDIFRIGVMVSAPVIVALLLTQFVMGLITKAVPTVNIFIVSFPLTIAIGMVLFIVALPDILRFISQEFSGVETVVRAVLDHSTSAVTPP